MTSRRLSVALALLAAARRILTVEDRDGRPWALHARRAAGLVAAAERDALEARRRVER